MNRFAFTLSVAPEAAGSVAGVLAYYLPGATLARNDRVVHVIDTDDDLDAIAARLSGRSHGAPITRVLAGYWRPPPDTVVSPHGDAFLAATVMETATHYERTGRAPLPADGRTAWCAHLLPMRGAADRVPADPLDDDGFPGRVLLSRTVFRHRDAVVCFRETGGGGSDSPEPSADRAMTLLSATHHWAGGDGEGPPDPSRPIGGLAHVGTHG